MIFIDANIFIYYITEDRKFYEASKNLILDVEKGKEMGYTSVIVLNEVLYTLLKGEAVEKGFCEDITKSTRYLRDNQDKIKKLDKSFTDMNTIMEMENLKILEITNSSFENSLIISQEYGLRPNDALHCAVMKENKLKIIASDDEDFKNVTGIVVKKPNVNGRWD